MVAYSDLTTDLFMWTLLTTYNSYLIPLSANFPPNCTSVFLKPQSAQKKEDSIISNKQYKIGRKGTFEKRNFSEKESSGSLLFTVHA